MTRADTIARLLNQAGEYLKAAACPGNPQVYATSGPALSIDAAMRCINAAFLECLGGAAVAGEAAGRGSPGVDVGANPAAQRLALVDGEPRPIVPWVVRVQHNGRTWWDPGANNLRNAMRFDRLAETERVAQIWRNSPAYPGATTTVLPLAEAERMEAAAALASLPAHTQQVLAELGDEEPSAEVLAADDSPDSTPEPPKPAGWVVRYSGGVVRWLCIRTREGAEGAWPKHEPFATREDAQRIADTTGGEVVPVDAAGNVIEAAGEVKAERDQLADAHRDVSAVAEEHAVAWHSLVDHIRTVADEVCGAQPVIAAAEALSLIESKAHTLRTALYRTEAERDRLRADLDAALTERADLRIALRAVEAERDALAAEVQRSHEQKPVRWAVVMEDGILNTWDYKAEADVVVAYAPASRRVAPLYLAPVVRDHSGVIAQCEEALREWDSKGAHCSATSSLVAVTLTKARNALRGAS